MVGCCQVAPTTQVIEGEGKELGTIQVSVDRVPQVIVTSLKQ